MNKLINQILCVISASYSAAMMATPLGDGKISTEPKIGYVYSCQTRFNPHAPGAVSNVPWITNDNIWQAEGKPIVSGRVDWPDSVVKISVEKNFRMITANNLPDHSTGVYPIQPNDSAFRYDRNPNPILAQNILLTLPANPQLTSAPSCVGMGMIGFTISGGAIFNALDAGGRDAVAHEIQDHCGGHPEKRGQYHYHGVSDCFNDKSAGQGRHSDLVGYALDGFGIFGLKGEAGKVLANGDLDVCHGHTHSISWDGQTVEIYHYHFTQEYPYTIGCFKGHPVLRSFAPPPRPRF